MSPTCVWIQYRYYHKQSFLLDSDFHSESWLNPGLEKMHRYFTVNHSEKFRAFCTFNIGYTAVIASREKWLSIENSSVPLVDSQDDMRAAWCLSLLWWTISKMNRDIWSGHCSLSCKYVRSRIHGSVSWTGWPVKRGFLGSGLSNNTVN